MKNKLRFLFVLRNGMIILENDYFCSIL